MFWAAGFGLAGVKGGGYIGIQDGVGRSDGTIGRVALCVTNGKTYASCAAVPTAATTMYAPTANAKTVAVIAGSSSINTDASCANVWSFTQPDLKTAIEEMNP